MLIDLQLRPKPGVSRLTTSRADRLEVYSLTICPFNRMSCTCWCNCCTAKCVWNFRCGKWVHANPKRCPKEEKEEDIAA
jgi:hypothetical protein